MINEYLQSRRHQETQLTTQESYLERHTVPMAVPTARATTRTTRTNCFLGQKGGDPGRSNTPTAT